MKPILGIDVAKAKLDLALRLPEGKMRSKVIDNTRQGFETLLAWLAKQGVDELHVCMEATGTYWEAAAEFLADAGHTVSVVNPAQIKAFATACLVRTKTDRLDARLIAEFCAAQHPEPWQAPSPAARELRALVRRRNALEAMRTQESNRLLVARETVRAGIEAHLEYLGQAIEQIEAAIAKKIDGDSGLKAQASCSTAFPAWARRPFRCCCPTTAGQRALTAPSRPPPSPAWTRASTSRAAVCAAGRVCPRSATPCCARPCTCRPW